METLVLDPAAAAINRTEWDITQFVGEAGPDWGDAAIEQYLADAESGSLPVGYRIPSRTITIPLLLMKSRDGVPLEFEYVRERFQHKAAVFQREGGVVGRSTSIGTVYADITGATLRLGGSTAQALWGIDADAVLTLTCLPDWYSDEVSSPVFTVPVGYPNVAILGGNYSKTALAFGPSLYWSLASSLGTFDQSGHLNHGGAGGGVTLGGVPGPFPGNTATDFDGVNDIIGSSYIPFANGGKLSVAGWAKRDTNGAIHTLFGSDANVAGTWVRLAISAGSNTVTFTVNGGTNVATWTNVWPGTGTWAYWVLTWDAATNRARFYVNAVFSSEGVMVPNSYSAPYDFTVGGHGNGSEIFDGAIAHVAVFLRVLSQPEINSLYLNGGSADLVAGNYPARVRMIVTESSGQTQNGLMWAVRSRNYSPAPTARMAYDTRDMVALDAAVADTTGIQHTSLATGWTPVMSTDLAINGPLSHVGNYRMWAVATTYSADLTTQQPKLRLVWDVGDLVAPVENSAQRLPQSDGRFLVDLGVVRLPRALVGGQRWRGVIQAAAGSNTNRSIAISRVFFQNFDEYAGVLTTPFNADPALRGYTARDEFRGGPGNLNGVAADAGGTWSSTGDAGDYGLTSGTPQMLVRTDAGPDATIGRLAVLPTVMTDVSVQVDISLDKVGVVYPGIVARNGGSNRIRAYLDVAGSAVKSSGGSAPFNFVLNTWYTLQLVVTHEGRVIVWCWPRGGSKGDPLFSYYDSNAATGGTYASGTSGLLDYNPSGVLGVTRAYDNFYTWVPDIDATLYPNCKAELRTDGMQRESIDGSYFGPISNVVGDLPRLPVTGLEQRPTEVLVVNSYGDFDSAPHYATFQNTSSTKLQLIYRPCYLFVP